MKARIIQIGNSRGIRLPKALLEQANLTEDVQTEAAAPNQIVIRSAHLPREGWDEAFRRMADRGDDRLEEEAASLTTFDETEWPWISFGPSIELGS
jgi:antitoxin MazE